MSELTCGTCANAKYNKTIGLYCPKHPAIYRWSVHPCHVLLEPCPPPGFLFTKRDGTQAAIVPMNERKPGSPWAWAVCGMCKGLGRYRQWTFNGWQRPACNICHGTGALRPAVEQHQVTR